MRRSKREDVAELAGVSPATVSYVLNKTKRLSPDVEKRVRDAAKKLNYNPDRIARTLAGARTNTLAFITSDITNTYQLEVIKGFQEEALKHDYFVYILDIHGNVEKYFDHLIERRVDGAYVSATVDLISDEMLLRLRDAGIKLLSDTSRMSLLEGVSYTMPDRRKGIFEAVEYLKQYGHSKIGFLSAFEEDWEYDIRLKSFEEAMNEYFPGSSPVFVVDSSHLSTESSGKCLMKRMLELHPEVTAVMATNDAMAIGAIEYLQTEGYRVPEDFSVIGIDNIAKSAAINPPLTTLDQNGLQYGAILCNMLEGIINGGENDKILTPIKLLKRNSVCVPREIR